MKKRETFTNKLGFILACVGSAVGMEKKLGTWYEPLTRYVFVGLTFIVYVLGIFYGGIG